MRQQILTLFNIRSDESWLVGNLFLLQFFQGAGIAIFNTVAFALFLSKFEVHELPKVYMFSALMLWIAGWLYSKAEHALPLKNLVPAVIVTIALSILAFRLQITFLNSPFFIFLMFSWYYVIYLLSNLEFWGVAALLFDIRQSKRLFGMIGAGDIPAKLVGYSTVPILIPFIGSVNLLFLSGLFILGSLFFYHRLRRAGKLDIHVAHEHHPEPSTQSFKDLVKGFFGNRMIAMVAGLSFIVMASVTIISFSFYSEIEHQEFTNEKLASFIALFFAGGRVLAILLKIVFTSRITSRIGTKGALLVSPVILFFFLLVIMLLPFIPHGPLAILYIFGIMAIVTEVLKSALQEPVFLSLMQPLSSSLRLKGHTIVKGVMDPFAMAFSGFMLFSLMEISQKVDLFLLSYLLFALLIVWVAMIFMVDKEYVKTLVKALHHRYSVGREIDLENEKTQKVLLDKIASGERGEALYVLHLLDTQYTPDKDRLILQALHHPAEEVKLEALRLVERRKVLTAVPDIDQMLHTENYPELKAEAVKAKCMLLTDELNDMDELLNEKNPQLVQAAVTGLMTGGGIAAVVTAGQKLLNLLASPDAEERKMAAQIIGDLGVSSFYKPLLQLIKDDNEKVVQAAIIASGKVRNVRLVVPVMAFFKNKKWESDAAEALYEMKDLALPAIHQALLHGQLSHKQQSRLILLCGRIGSERAIETLDDLVWTLPTMRRLIFHALHLCEFTSQPHHRSRHIELMQQYLDSAVNILFMIQALPPSYRILADALHLELDEIRDSLLLLLSFVYDKEKMIKAKHAFQMKKKENIANALEIIEIAVPKDISAKFIAAFEPASLSDRCLALNAYSKEAWNNEKVIDEILNHRHFHYHRWTRAAAIYCLQYFRGNQRNNWLNIAAAESDILVHETATKILAETN